MEASQSPTNPRTPSSDLLQAPASPAPPSSASPSASVLPVESSAVPSTSPSAPTPPAGALVGPGSRCLSGGGAAPQAGGTALVFVECTGSADQTWATAHGSLQVLDKCLDVEGGATTAGSRIQLFGCNRTSAQLWQFTSRGELVNLPSGRCLDAAGFLLKDCDHSAGQRWILY
ncbi:RICIN domain-containing protein [Streptomyces sp. NPDC046977]|uniref:RICIN domain-containing protein n=1 Tax=Streptomyces sp. NPDC046977 TaxID=3154703 RepID=UPI0034068B8A